MKSYREVIALALLVSSASLHALDVSVSGLMPNQVFAVIDGKTRVLKAGQTSPEGVTLISADSQQAVFEVEGKRITRALSRHHGGTVAPAAVAPTVTSAEATTATTAEAAPAAAAAAAPQDQPVSGELAELAQASAQAQAQSATNEARLVRGPNQHFFSTGQINGKAVSFMVDTGAYSVAMGYGEADRLGLNWKAGKRITASTAAGPAAGYEINLHSVKVGNITLNNVKGTVIVADIGGPILLGMSFMSRVSMREENNQLVLTKKY